MRYDKQVSWLAFESQRWPSLVSYSEEDFVFALDELDDEHMQTFDSKMAADADPIDSEVVAVESDDDLNASSGPVTRRENPTRRAEIVDIDLDDSKVVVVDSDDDLIEVKGKHNRRTRGQVRALISSQARPCLASARS